MAALSPTVALRLSPFQTGSLLPDVAELDVSDASRQLRALAELSEARSR